MFYKHALSSLLQPFGLSFLFKKGLPIKLFLPHPVSAPWRIWSKNYSTCKAPWVLHQNLPSGSVAKADNVFPVHMLVALKIYFALAVFQPCRDLEAADNQSLKFKWRDGESNPGPLAPQPKSLSTRPPPLRSHTYTCISTTPPPPPPPPAPPFRHLNNCIKNH